jgi:hypothetical protein
MRARGCDGLGHRYAELRERLSELLAGTDAHDLVPVPHELVNVFGELDQQLGADIVWVPGGW